MFDEDIDDDAAFAQRTNAKHQDDHVHVDEKGHHALILELCCVFTDIGLVFMDPLVDVSDHS